MAQVAQANDAPTTDEADTLPQRTTEALRKLWTPRALGIAIAWYAAQNYAVKEFD